MEEYRKIINKCDEEIIILLKERFEVAKKIGNYKKENNFPIFDAEREKLIFEKLCSYSDNNLTKESIYNIFKTIIEESKSLQSKL